jgi:hypothetical protein
MVLNGWDVTSLKPEPATAAPAQFDYLGEIIALISHTLTLDPPSISSYDNSIYAVFGVSRNFFKCGNQTS